MKKTFAIFVCFVFFVSNFTACSARRPSLKRAQSVTFSYLKKYGRQHPETPFGKGSLSQVTINGIEEVSYKIVNTDAIIHFQDGQMARSLLKMETRFPKGWHVKSWEILGIQ